MEYKKEFSNYLLGDEIQKDKSRYIDRKYDFGNEITTPIKNKKIGNIR
ncbi:hypothetical protein [Dethiothermospora halolimnae]